MITVLIVDDNILFVNEVRKLISESCLNIEVIGQALDGLTAATMVLDLTPDIVLADVDMPGMNGVELSAFIREQAPETSLIAMSNYDNYEFVRPIMMNGAVDYLLKHELNADLLAAKIDLALDSMTSAASDARRKLIGSRAQANRALQSYLYDLLWGVPGVSCTDAFAQKHEPFRSTIQGLIIVRLLAFHLRKMTLTTHHSVLAMKSASSLCTSICESMGHAVVCSPREGEIAILLGIDDSITFHEQTQKMTACIQTLQHALRRIMRYASTADFFVFRDGLNDVPDVYSCLSMKINRISELAEKHSDINKASSPPIVDMSGFADSLQAGEEQKAQSIFTSILEAYSPYSMDFERLLCDVLEICHLYIRETPNIDTDLIENLHSKIGNVLFPEDALPLISDAICQICEAKTASIALSPYVRHAIRFVQGRFSDNISVKAIAEELHLSESYLSKLFSREMGTSLTDYIVQTRLSQSRRYLLHTDLSVKEVADSCGYSHSSYFIKQFREMYGVTPLQYRRGVMNSVDPTIKPLDAHLDF